MFNIFKKKIEPPKPSFKESVVMLATVVATVIAAGTAAFKAVCLAFDIVVATPAYIKDALVCSGSYLAIGWNFITYVPRTTWAKIKSLMPARTPAATTTTTTDPAATTVSTETAAA